MPKKKVYTLDFETENNQINITEKYTRVWLWDVCDFKFNHTTGRTIDECMEYVMGLKACVIYSHNLKFDGNFIVSWLLKNGYNWVEKVKSENEFGTLITETKMWYCIRVKFNTGIIEFRDSSKKVSGSVEKIAKAYDLKRADGSDLRKGEIDYTMYRDESYIPTNDEIDYVRQDTEIIERVMVDMHADGLDKMTTASDALNYYKLSIGRKIFDNLYPEFSYEDDLWVRKAYRGGACIVNPKHLNVEIDSIIRVYDENSMYPHKMWHSLLPYGEFEKGKGKIDKKVIERKPLYIQRVLVDLKLKDGCMPSILLNSAFYKNDWLYDTDGMMVDLTLTCIDLELMYLCYDVIDIKYIEWMAFCGSRKLFSEYVNTWYEIKNNSKGSKKQKAKLMLNALYGKFAMNPVQFIIEPFLDENGVVRYNNLGSVIGKTIYTPISCFITAYARYDLLTKVKKLGDDFIYCDTDSIHTLASEDYVNNILECDNKKLGAWKLENVFSKGKYLGAKTYFGKIADGGDYIKVCGCPEKVKKSITFDGFKYNSVYDGKLLPMAVKGGVVLASTTFEIKDRRRKKKTIENKNE